MADAAPGADQQVVEPPVDPQDQDPNCSTCLLLGDDKAKGKIAMVKFSRDTKNIHRAAGRLLGFKKLGHLRCFPLPLFEKEAHGSMVVNMYLDLHAVEHHAYDHQDPNTNATQLFLVANLPDEPPELQPAEIAGPVLLTAEYKSGGLVDLDMAQWDKIKAACWAVKAHAQFLDRRGNRRTKTKFL
jgi:hypothetical protein